MRFLRLNHNWWELSGFGENRPGWEENNCRWTGPNHGVSCDADAAIGTTLPPGEQGFSIADSVACGTALSGYLNSGVTDVAWFFTGPLSSALLWAYDMNASTIINTGSMVAGESPAPGIQDGEGFAGTAMSQAGATFNVPIIGTIGSWIAAGSACRYSDGE